LIQYEATHYEGRPMKPHVICHMVSSIDGKLAPSRWTKSPDGTRADWSASYEAIHGALKADAWIVGRVTMGEMAKGEPHPPTRPLSVERPHHFADRDAKSFAVAVDRSGRLHFERPDINGDHVVVLLGSEVSDAHLAELAGDGVSYIVSDAPDIDLAAALDVLGQKLGIERLALEGGGGMNGSFLAAGLVDELSVIVAPALDGQHGGKSIVDSGDTGLAGQVELSLTSSEKLDHGAVHLRYAVKAV
jgi:riboflavin biosynthesis pyrimidine reductase